jgi:hypothetical protein
MLTLDQLRSLDTEEKSAVIIGYLGVLRYAIGHAITVCRRIEMAELRYVLPIILEKEHLVLSVGEGARYSLPFLTIDLLSLRDEITIGEGLGIFFGESQFPTPIQTILGGKEMLVSDIRTTTAFNDYFYAYFLSPGSTIF